MRRREEAVFETLRQIQCFLDNDAGPLDVVNHSGARRRLDETLARFTAHAVAQVGGRRLSEGETARQHVLRQELRSEHMGPIAVIAGQYLREQPEFTQLRLPPWKFHRARLTAAARDMANAAEKYTELFIEEGLAPDFVAELRTAADRLDQSIDERGQSRGQRAGATEGLKAETKRARALIRLLDLLVRPKLGTNDELLRAWQVARHIKRDRVSATSTAEATTPSVVPASKAVAA
jgi:hypothetical protein